MVTSGKETKLLDFDVAKILSYSDEEIDWVTAKTVTGFSDYCNPDFLDYRKSVSKDYAAVEWLDICHGY